MRCNGFKRPFCEVFRRWYERHDDGSVFITHQLASLAGLFVALVDHKGMVDDVVDVLHQDPTDVGKIHQHALVRDPETVTTSPSISASNR